ncbi:MAG: aminopeptidase [Oscillospiraceae bacterium]|nr:aminopeptidase [Oscillospiraceae bacterium]
MTKGKNSLKDELLYSQKHVEKIITKDQKNKSQKFSEGYKEFLKICKTERECVEFIKEKAEKLGFKEYELNKKYKAGDKVYYINKNKAMFLLTIGKKSLAEGLNIVASHIDSPRIDLKAKPLYEDSEIAYFKTNYYGGLRKYQWPTLPLALHGRIMKKDGQELDICIGEKEEDPVFYITDLLPHLADEQAQRPLSKAISGEDLNLIVGSLPYCEEGIDGANLVKLNAMKILNDKYGIVEKDLINAELSLVPALLPRDVGLDRGLIGAYGQDDRVCAYSSLMAHLELKTPNYTTITMFADKEEVGSEGNTGLDSLILEYFVQNLAQQQGANYREVLTNSKCLSADVNAAFDPSWAGVFEKQNTAKVNYGAVVTKYTGSRGKSGTSDASAEFMYEITSLLDKNNVIWQTGMLGKVDTGGGGTVAKYIARLNVDVVDVGVPVLSMHAPYELTSKLDVFMLNKAFKAFINR